MRVLIIDDSLVMRMIVERVLRRALPMLEEVLQAGDGAEGLAALENAGAPFDLILCDVHMPVMDGLAFLLEKERRQLAPRVPVVMITAESADPEFLRAMSAGANGYISKPFTLEQMQASVSSLLHCAA